MGLHFAALAVRLVVLNKSGRQKELNSQKKGYKWITMRRLTPYLTSRVYIYLSHYVNSIHVTNSYI